MASEDYTSKETIDIANESAEQSCLPDILSNTLQGSSLAFSSIYSTLQKVQEQNQQLTQSMDKMMRYMIQTKLSIDTQIDTSRLIITLNNATDYTAKIVVANLVLTPIIVDDDSPSTFDIQESVTVKHISSSPHTTNQCEPTDSLFMNTSSTPFLLPPHSNYREVLCINTSRPAPYHGRIDIEIPIFGHDVDKDDQNGINPLHLTHSFGIYIIDQIKKVTVDEKRYGDEEDDGLERFYRGDFIRHTLAIPPMLGLEQGMRFCLDMASDESVIVCRIESISFDMVQVRFFSKNKVLVRILVVELDTLAS